MSVRVLRSEASTKTFTSSITSHSTSHRCLQDHLAGELSATDLSDELKEKIGPFKSL